VRRSHRPVRPTHRAPIGHSAAHRCREWRPEGTLRIHPRDSQLMSNQVFVRGTLVMVARKMDLPAREAPEGTKMSSSYWTSRRISRRGVIRGGGLTGVGLAGAAPIGCGGDDDDPEPS